MQVGIREIRNRLSRYLKRVRQGETIVITDRNIPVAKIIPIKEQELEDILALQKAGLAAWHGGKPEGLINPPAVKDNRLVSDIIAKDRR